MWGFLSKSHDPINANENIENRPYICLGLLSNLEDRQRPVDYILIILVILYIVLYSEDHFSPSWGGVPLGALYGFWGKKRFYKFLCVLKSIVKHDFLWLRVACSLVGYTLVYITFGCKLIWHVVFILCFWNGAWFVSWSFTCIFFEIWSYPCIPEFNYFWWNNLQASLHKICPIWGYCAFPHGF